MLETYIKFLEHLAAFPDHDFHEIESYFMSIPEREMQSILKELSIKGYLKFTKREDLRIRALAINTIMGINTPVKFDNPIVPYKAKITFDGREYIKNNKKRNKVEATKIKVGKNYGSIVIDSPHSSITIAKSESLDKINEALEKIKKDIKLDILIRDAAIENLNLISTMISQNTFKGDSFNFQPLIKVAETTSTIGSFVLALIEFLVPKG